MSVSRRFNLGEPDQTLGEGTVLFGGSGLLGPFILDAFPRIVSVGRTPPPTANRHIAIESLADLGCLDDLEFDKVIYIIGNTDHYAMDREVIPRGEPTAFDHHIIPFLQTMEQLKRYPISKVINFSTALIYDQERMSLPVSERSPIDPYKSRYVFSKYLVEEAARFYSRWLPTITCRMCNLYGPTTLERFDLIHILLRQILRTGRAQAWTDRPSRDFIYCEDAARAIVRLLYSDYVGVLVLGTGVKTPVRRVFDTIERVTGCPVEVLGRPVSGPEQFRADPTLLKSLIDWEPRFPIEQGIVRTYELMSAWSRP